MKVVSLSSVFPNPAAPGHGVFVRSRLRRLAELVELKVIAPVPFFDYANRRVIGKLESSRHDGPIEIRYPRWIHAPGGGFFNGIGLFAQLWLPLSRLRRDFAFQLIDAHFGHPEGVAAALLAAAFRCPFTITLRGSEPIHARRPLRRRWMAWALRRADRVLAVSEPLRQFAISLGVRPDRVRTVPNGVDAAIFFPRDRVDCRIRHGVSPGQRVVLSAGRLVREKGYLRIARALQTLDSRGLNAELWIAGTGPDERRLRDQIRELGIGSKVRFMGQVRPDVLAELMSAVDVFCLASGREGWPNVVHEALSCGVPVVATDVGAVSSMVASPAFGHVVPVDDGSALEAALESTLRRRWDRTAIAAWGRCRSWDQVASEVHQEITEVLKENVAAR